MPEYNTGTSPLKKKNKCGYKDPHAGIIVLHIKSNCTNTAFTADSRVKILSLSSKNSALIVKL